ncbi:MAG: 16S rRNA processing protein RimM [Bacilli bacterium]|nr:16S rRNA processing protein RimM [Bacilli bacterium]
MGKLIIGKIINTRGLKGEMKVDNKSSFIKDRYKSGNIVYLSKDEENFIEKTIVKYSFTKGFIYLTLEGIDDIDKANEYREYYIFCEDEKLNESKDVYHYLTLKDMDVIFNDTVIGKVINIESNGRQDLLRIDTGNKTFLVPFLNEFIVNIDKEKKTITLTNIGVFYEN